MKTRRSTAGRRPRLTHAIPFAALAATLALSQTAAAQEAPGAPLAPRADTFHTESRALPELYVTGPILLGVTYGITVATTAATAARPDVGRATSYAAIPVVGPWVMLGSNLPTLSYSAALVVSGIAQAGGLAVTIAGLVVRRDVTLPSVANDKVRVTFVPSAGGAFAVGSF